MGRLEGPAREKREQGGTEAHWLGLAPGEGTAVPSSWVTTRHSTATYLPEVCIPTPLCTILPALLGVDSYSCSNSRHFGAFAASFRLRTKRCLVIYNLGGDGPSAHSLKVRPLGSVRLAQRHVSEEWWARPQAPVEAVSCHAVPPLVPMVGWCGCLWKLGLCRRGALWLCP